MGSDNVHDFKEDSETLKMHQVICSDGSYHIRSLFISSPDSLECNRSWQEEEIVSERGSAASEWRTKVWVLLHSYRGLRRRDRRFIRFSQEPKIPAQRIEHIPHIEKPVLDFAELQHLIESNHRAEFWQYTELGNVNEPSAGCLLFQTASPAASTMLKMWWKLGLRCDSYWKMAAT